MDACMDMSGSAAAMLVNISLLGALPPCDFLWRLFSELPIGKIWEFPKIKGT